MLGRINGFLRVPAPSLTLSRVIQVGRHECIAVIMLVGVVGVQEAREEMPHPVVAVLVVQVSSLPLPGS
jgi:hypothetical protein